MKTIEHLYLTVGTDPVSNYAVADFFLENQNLKTIHFIHSTEDSENNIQSTEPFAAHLKSVLDKKAGDTRIFLHGIRIKDSFSIHKDIQNILSDFESSEKSDLKNVQTIQNVHLDYSGGTKEMALHSYETFKDVLGERVTFSYYDSRRNRLKEDSELGEPVDSVFLGDKVEIDFADLFELHGYSIIENEEHSGFVFSVEFFKEFLDALQDRENFENYLDWRDYFFSVYPDSRKVEPAENKVKLSDLLPPEFPISKVLEKMILKIHDEMPEYSFLEEKGGEYYLKTDVSNKQTDKLIETRKYIVGRWFEQYVYVVLKENLLEKEIISSLDLNIMIQSATKNFEIDVAMIKGYEFFGVSCTTDKTQSLCKSKGFEILHRTKQIAGEDSKAILMTFMNEENTAEIDADLSDLLEDRLLVLGRDDLFPKEKFCQKIVDFLSS
ncbi:hypothetical protein MmiHf6_11940 [Methanimicrococcus hongohii]|uniref:DUF1887 family protein n=1 Tax=Methanimicrococcus hongohii TaxID=3028295 RepID=A0AA96ZU40_9EURY|nr:hypothetical protein [Methanimicrococcus sp. Hf6]WNY23871.1 hypothetical protein MmiHf6_11940 [Methanimicrococcus sp. Hf6]